MGTGPAKNGSCSLKDEASRERKPLLVEGLQKAGWLDMKCTRERHDVQQRDVSLPALDPSDVVAMQTRQLRKLFLGKSLFETKPAQVLSERESRVGTGHLVIFGR